VESGTPGVTQYRIAHSFGHRAGGWGGIIFNNVEVNKDNLIGEENRALSMFLDIWNYDRVLVALLSLGMAEASLEDVINYSKQRIVFGQRLADLQHIQFLIAEDYTLIESAKLLAYKALQMRDQGLLIMKEAAMAKWYAIDVVAQKVVDDAIQIHGAIGYTEELPLERRYREIRGFRIAAGSSEIMKRTIAREILK
jgi:alkylation response protein AidB-like acyl-CoA dehydrogenase